MSDPSNEWVEKNSIEQNWKALVAVRHEFATELNRIGEELPGDRRRQINKITGWLKGEPKLSEALENPDALAVCVPLLQMARDSDVAVSEIAIAARRGFCLLGRSVAVGRRLFTLLIYPLVVLLAALGVWTGFSFWVSPQFEDMFKEFGIELPHLTKWVLQSSEIIRESWWIVGLVLAVCFFFLILGSRQGSGRGGSSQSWIDERLMSTRSALASWSWHLSLLFEAGIDQSVAFKSAANATGNKRLRESSLLWSSLQSNVESSGAGDAQQRPYFTSPGYQLLNRSLQLESRAGKIAMLRETAIYYWEHCRTVGEWWVYWLVSCILLMVAGAILLAIVSLLLPLISLVGGLTGF